MSSKEGSDSIDGVLRRAWKDATDETRPGPRKAYSLDKVLDASIRLYDEVGAGDFSLARLAKSLDLTTNALYRYVDSRDELEALVRDRALGRPTLTPSDRWDDTVRNWANSLFDRYAAHPWLAQVPVRIPYTPNALAWLDSLLQALRARGFDLQSQLSAAGLLDNHVRACAVATSDLAKSKGIRFPSDLVKKLEERGLGAVSSIVTSGLYENDAPSGKALLQFGVGTFIAGLDATVVRTD